ncbi:uncharacterized protein F54H12.2 [Trichonephila clavipes]|nr:uncharacterized protein F54H12.2 [Trichonephila clavipes]
MRCLTFCRSSRGRVVRRADKGKEASRSLKSGTEKDAYTLHKPVRHKFQRNRVFVSDIDRQFQADLVDMQSLAEFNKGFYVYSDLISPQIVGDTQALLLRIVRTKGKDGKTISQYYDRPQYLPLVRHSFQTIQSELRLNSGDFVPFERGQILSGLTHYKGINFQKGYGIGGIFRRLFRAALPILVKGGKTIGKEVLMTGSRVASDVLSGEKF